MAKSSLTVIARIADELIGSVGWACAEQARAEFGLARCVLSQLIGIVPSQTPGQDRLWCRYCLNAYMKWLYQQNPDPPPKVVGARRVARRQQPA